MQASPTRRAATGHRAVRVTERDMAARMGRMIAALPDREREVLVLRLVRRFTVEETAESLGTTPQGVLIAEHVALDRLRASIARGCG